MRVMTSMACAMAIVMLACGDASAAEKKYDTIATDSEIKIGNTMPYSGQGSTWSLLGKAEAAYCVMRQASNIRNFEIDMLMPGIKVSTSPDDLAPIKPCNSAACWESGGSRSARL